jgi:hypothetical protein
MLAVAMQGVNPCVCCSLDARRHLLLLAAAGRTLLASVHSVSRSRRSNVKDQGAPCSRCSVELQQVSLWVLLLLLCLLLLVVAVKWHASLLLQVDSWLVVCCKCL